MKLILTEPHYLKDSIMIISELVNEAVFSVDQNGLGLVAMDPANVAMVIYRLLPTCFAEYSVESPQQLGINLSNFKPILRRAKGNDAIVLETDQNKLKIQLRGDTIRTFSIPLIEIEEKEQRIPDLTFPVNIETNASMLSEAIEDVDIVAESVSFIGDDKKLIISAEGDLSKAQIEIQSSEDTIIKSEGQDKIKAKYSIEYLKKMMAGSKISSRVSIHFSNDYPLKLEYKETDKVMINFILAPRVDND